VDAANSDQSLVVHCIAGDGGAWERLYQRCHPVLLRSIGAILGPGRRDRHLIEEIGARVWFVLATNSGRFLDQFQPTRASLNTYLALIARTELSAYLRSERRRKRREVVAAEMTPTENSRPAELGETIDEFVRTLTPREKEFCHHYLLAQITHNGKPISSASTWQLRHRVHRKLLKFLSITQSSD